MKTRCKHIISILLLMVFLMPSVVKIEHHHDHGKLDDYTEHPSQEYHENCVICNFEFSAFMPFDSRVNFEAEEYSKQFINDYISAHFQNLSRF